MMKLKHIPQLELYLKNLFKFFRLSVRFDIGEKLYLYSRCGCGDKTCATFKLKKSKPWKKKYLGKVIYGSTNKGFFVFHFLKDGFLKIEIIDEGKNFPYKKEFEKVFLYNTTDRIKKRYPLNKMQSTDRINISRYFKSIKHQQITNIICD